MGVASRLKAVRDRLKGSTAAEAGVDERQCIVDSGVFDDQWYAFEVGRSFASPTEALDHYLASPDTNQFAPHPLFTPAAGGRKRGGLSPLGAYLTRPKLRAKSPFPGWLMERYIRQWPASVDHPQGVFAHLAGRLGPEDELDFVGPDGPIRLRWDRVLPRWREVVSTMAHQRDLSPAPFSSELAHADDVATATPEQLSDGPLVSIVIPTWNRREVLLAALESVRAQDWQRWEAIVVDDGSDDGTIEAVERLAAEDPRFVLVPRPHEGVCRARNSGLSVARGDYVAFLDSDNEWQPAYLSRMIATMERDGLGAAYGALMVETDDGPRYRSIQVDLEMLLVSNHVDMNVLIVRADVMREVGGFDESLRRTVDYDLVLRIARTEPLRHLPVVGVRYENSRERSDRISVKESVTWNDVVLGKHHVDWDDVEASPRQADLVSIVLPVSAESSTLRPALEALAEGLADRPWEVIVVDSTAKRAVPALLLGMLVADERVKHVPLPRRMSFSLAANIGLARTRGDVVMVIDEGLAPNPEAVAALADRVRQAPGPILAQATTVDHEGTIVTSGSAFPEGESLPGALLAGQPASILQNAPGEVHLAVLDGRLFASRAADLIALRGLDPLFDRELEVADLSLRAREARPDVETVLLPMAGAVRHRTTWRKDENVPTSAFRDRSAPTRRSFVERHGVATPTAPSVWTSFGIAVSEWSPLSGSEYAFQARLRPLG